MQCQKCAMRATHHITDIDRGKTHEFHLCDEHASQHLASSEKPMAVRKRAKPFGALLTVLARPLAARVERVHRLISTIQGGLPMEAEPFERSLRAFQLRTPFRPFTVVLVNGDRFQVDLPEALVLRDGVAVFIAAGGVPTLFDHTRVSDLVAEPSGQTTA